MANNPINLVFRFMLELSALAALGYWGYHRFPGELRLVFMFLTPLFGAWVWGTFRIPAESPRGRAPVAVPGPVRLLIEALLFGFSTWGLFDVDAAQAGLIFGGAVLLHYLISYDRLASLLFHRKP